MTLDLIETVDDLARHAGASDLLIVHAQGGWLDALDGDGFDFFTHLAPVLDMRNIAQLRTALWSELSNMLLDQPHLHLILGDAPGYRPNVLHVKPSYLWGFWYIDEVGVNAHSSLRLQDFRPDGVDGGHAEWFFNGVAGHMIRENVSKSPQPERVEWMEPAAAAVFCQDIEGVHPRSYALATDDMIRNTARAARGAKVYVKPHPAQSDATRRRVEKACATDPNIIVTQASVHDVIAASEVVVTQNSAAGFEALLHRKPVVTCGHCDYHHATLTARTGDELRAQIRGAAEAMQHFPYDKYLYWFLSECNLEPQKDDFGQRAWAKIAEKSLLPKT